MGCDMMLTRLRANDRIVAAIEPLGGGISRFHSTESACQNCSTIRINMRSNNSTSVSDRRGIALRFRLLLKSLFVGLALIFGGVLPRATADDLQYSLDADSGRFEVTYKGRRVMLYVFATNQFKPYVKELYSLSGENVLLDAPPDHLHHHGLMYAITVNGINFWEEAKDPGVEKPFGAPACGTTEAPVPSVWFAQTLHWVHNKDRWATNTAKAALLIERRTLTLAVNELDQEVAVRWQGSFRVGPSVEKVVLSGSAYHGLGLRFPRTWDRVARHQNSGGIPYSAEQKGDVTPALWTATSNTLDGKEIMVAVFARRQNAGTPKFFTMLDGFAYVSATQDLQNIPIEYKTGEEFSIDYLVAVYSAHKTREFLNSRAER